MSTISSGLRAGGALTTLLMLLALCGCGAESVRSLRRMPDSVYSCEVPADCRTVYERIAQRARRRYALTDRRTYQPSVSATLFPDQQAASVSLSNAGRIGLQYVLHADIRRLDAPRTQVDIYCGTAGYQQEAQRWRLWAQTPLGGRRALPPEQTTQPPAPPEPSAPETYAAPTE
jgi:hypothetical protein